MTIRLIDPGGPRQAAERRLAPRLERLDNLKFALLANGKHNADVLLREMASLFEMRHGCSEAASYDKRNAGNPCNPERLQTLHDEADFLITAVGD